MTMLWTWVCLFVCITITMIGYEIVLTPNALHGEFKQSHCGNYSLGTSPAASRLVIFVVDSLRNDAANNQWISQITSASYGRGVAIAASTITRPALVAMFAGHYDVIFNSLPFSVHSKAEDSVFRHVENTYYFGPTLFTRYFEGGGQWITKKYYPNWLNLKGRADLADDYIMDSIQDMFNKSDLTKMKQKNIYYIHLTSLSLLGHKTRIPKIHLDKGLNSIGEKIRRTVAQFDNYFNSSGTVYMIASDHGMTDWGTYGDSLPEERYAPVIMWGNGIAAGYHPKINQTDLCPLISAILGITVPAQSIGVLSPSYLNTSHDMFTYGTMCNAVQLTQLCLSTWKQIERGMLIKLVLGKTKTGCAFRGSLEQLAAYMKIKNYSQVKEIAHNLTIDAQLCLQNVQNFYKAGFLFVLLMSYFAWMFGTVCTMTTRVPGERSFKTCAGKVFVVITCMGYLAMMVFSVLSVIVERLPFYFSIFFVIPSFAWLMTTLRTGICLTRFIKTNILMAFLYLFLLLAMVEYTYWIKYNPYFYGVFLLLYSCGVVVINHKYVPYHVTTLYVLTSIAIGFAPLLTILGLTQSAVLLNVSSALWIVGSCFFSYVLELKTKACLLTLAMTGTVCLSTWIIDLTYLGSSLLLKILAWLVLPTPIVTLMGSNVLAERMLQVIVSMGGPYLLLSSRHEPLVLMLLILNLYCFLRLEASSPQYEGQTVIRGLILHFYLELAIFSTGNVPYLSSYDLIWTRLFLFQFDEIVHSMLLIYKLTILLTVVTCFFCAICLYIGTGLKVMLLVTTLSSAVSSGRHALGILVSSDPISRLSEFYLGNILFLLLVIPFNFAILLITVKQKPY